MSSRRRSKRNYLNPNLVIVMIDIIADVMAIVVIVPTADETLKFGSRIGIIGRIRMIGCVLFANMNVLA